MVLKIADALPMHPPIDVRKYKLPTWDKADMP